MGDFRPASLFVSHSHRDIEVVRPLIHMNEDLKVAAWVDYLHTPPGSNWSDVHEKAISHCYRLVLLWSCNAAKSSIVEQEWRYALKCKTPIVPVLLDDTPLPSELSNIHAVSLREYIVSNKGQLLFGRSPSVGWMGVGSFGSAIGAFFGVLVLIAAVAASWLGIRASLISLNILGWLSVPIVLYLLYATIWSIQVELTRCRLRYRLSRIVVSSLKEWGVENRATSKDS